MQDIETKLQKAIASQMLSAEKLKHITKEK